MTFLARFKQVCLNIDTPDKEVPNLWQVIKIDSGLTKVIASGLSQKEGLIILKHLYVKEIKKGRGEIPYKEMDKYKLEREQYGLL